MEFTGERLVPQCMHKRPDLYTEHVIRYAIAARYCAGKSVLDIACGTGYGMKIIEPLAKEVCGGDIDDGTVDYAKTVYGIKNIKKINLSKQRVSDVFKKKFDVIVSFETIEHIKGYAFMIESVRSALKPGGHFIFSVPVRNESKFHFNVFNYTAALSLGKRFFKNVKIYIQTASMVIPLSLVQSPMDFRGVYVIKVMN